MYVHLARVLSLPLTRREVQLANGEEDLKMAVEQPNVDVNQAVTLLNRGDVRLLDVREDDEWAAGHAPEAEHVRLADLDPNTFGPGSVVVTCRSGNRSTKASRTLVEAGIDAYNLDGGMKAWEQAGRPVVRDDGTPGAVS